MARYTVHAPDGPDALERAVFVRDGFSFWAMSYGPLWLIRHGHWLTGIVTGLILALVLIGLFAMGLPSPFLGFCYLLIMLLFALEGASLRRFALKRGGYREIGLVVGDDLDGLERRFFAEYTALEKHAVKSPAMTPGMNRLPVQSGILGLFPKPEGRRS